MVSTVDNQSTGGWDSSAGRGYNSESKGSQIIKDYDRLYSMRTKNWDTWWETISTFVLPNRSDFITKRVKGDYTRTENIFDSTAVYANEMLANAIHGGITTGIWFKLKMRDNALNSIGAVGEWLDECTTRMLDAFNESNFGLEVVQMYKGLTTFGTSAIDVMPKSRDLVFDGLRFTDMHLGDFVFAEDADGLVDRTYFQFDLGSKAIVDKWGDLPGNTNKMEDQRKAVDEGQPDKVYKVVVHRFRRDIDNPSVDPAQPEGRRPYEEAIVLKHRREIIGELGLFEQPTLVTRWSKVTSDIYGFSPAMKALPDIMTLNEVKRLELSAWEKDIDPPKAVVTGTLITGELHQEAGGVTMVSRPGGIGNLNDPSAWQQNIFKASELQDNIRKMFYENQLMLPDRSGDTATEVRIRHDLMRKLLGPTYGRIQTEFLSPLINRVFYMMYRGGALPEIPQEAVSGGNDEIDVEYTSPFALAAQAEDVNAISNLSGWTANMAQIKPEVLKKFDVMDAFDIMAKRSGVPASVIIDTETAQAAHDKDMKDARDQEVALAQAAAGPQPEQAA